VSVVPTRGYCAEQALEGTGKREGYCHVTTESQGSEKNKGLPLLENGTGKTTESRNSGRSRGGVTIKTHPRQQYRTQCFLCYARQGYETGTNSSGSEIIA
jgi:hypothetical protein